MGEGKRATYSVRGTIDFRQEMSPERAQEVLAALGALGIHLDLASEVSAQSLEPVVGTEGEPPDKLVTVDDLIAYANEYGATRELAVKAWNGLRRANEPASYKKIADSLRFVVPSNVWLTPREQASLAQLSLFSLQEVVMRIDAVLRRSKSPTRQMEILGSVLGNNIGPKTFAFLHAFAFSFEDPIE